MCEIDKEWMKEIQEKENRDKAVLKQIESKVSKGVFKEILEELKECEYTYDYQITKEPLGKMREFDEYEYIEGVYVDQTTNGGISGDSFAGTCSIKISETEYFQFAYSM